MRHPCTIHISALAVLALAGSGMARAGDDWPTRLAFDDGAELALIGVYRYDVNTFSDDRDASGAAVFADAHTNRRKELGLTLSKKGVYDIKIDYDFQAKAWLDNTLRLQSKALFDRDLGAFRFGYSKTPVSFEGNTSSKATAFLERALPVQAIYEGRRTGVDWQFERPGYVVNLGGYWGQDLRGDNDGTTIAGRVAWTPRKSAGDVLHLGVSASREDREGTSDGRGVYQPPGARFRSPPESGLTPVRLVDTETLADVGGIDRAGFEGLWINGPWSLQGEWLRANVARRGQPDFDAGGYYVFGSWMLTGESRPYHAGNVGNAEPTGRWGAFELLLRYSALDLDDGPVQGGREHDWTLGANWYLTTHFKVQLNVVRAWSDRGDRSLDPRIFEARIQLMF